MGFAQCVMCVSLIRNFLKAWPVIADVEAADVLISADELFHVVRLVKQSGSYTVFNLTEVREAG